MQARVKTHFTNQNTTDPQDRISAVIGLVPADHRQAVQRDLGTTTKTLTFTSSDGGLNLLHKDKGTIPDFEHNVHIGFKLTPDEAAKLATALIKYAGR